MGSAAPAADDGLQLASRGRTAREMKHQRRCWNGVVLIHRTRESTGASHDQTHPPRLHGIGSRCCGFRRLRHHAIVRAGQLSNPAGDHPRALGRGRRDRCGHAHDRVAPGERPRPAVQRHQPHRRWRRRRSYRHRRQRAGWLHARHDHDRSRHDALAGPLRSQAVELHRDSH